MTEKRSSSGLDGAKILIDGRWNGPNGIGRFASEITRRLGGTHHWVNRRIPLLNPAEPMLLAAQATQVRPDVFFTPAFTVPWRAPCPIVGTIHDLIHLHIRAERNRVKELYYERLLKPTLLRSPTILTVSEFSRLEIADWLRVDPTRIAVVGDGTDMRRDDVEPGLAGRRRPYLLYVGNTKPHKNLQRLLDAFGRSDFGDLELVLVGPGHRPGPGPVAAVGVVDERSLRHLYRDAVAVVIPSIYEGFGLPALEALAMGTPVLASAIPPLQEVLGDLATYVDPSDTEAITDGLHRITDSDLHSDDWVQRRTARAADFSWDRVAANVEAALAGAISPKAS